MRVQPTRAVKARPVEESALYVQIYNLRKKLSQKRQPGEKAPPSCIQTKSGRGYRLLATVIPIDTRGTSTYFTPLDDSQADLRLTVEVRHVHHQPGSALPWRGGGLFRIMSPGDHERIVRFVFAELRSRHAIS